MDPRRATRTQQEERLDELLFRVLSGYDEGDASSLERVLSEHPHEAVELRARFDLLVDLGFTQPLAPDLPPSVPQHIAGFRIVRQLGAGGMGVVYLAVEEALGRTVALKLMHPTELAHPGGRERFSREAAAAARLAHPGIVALHRIGESEGAPFCAMEYIPGVTFAEAVAALATRDPARLLVRDVASLLLTTPERALAGVLGDPDELERPFTEFALRLVHQIALALAHAHERGVRHRDVKPANVMIGLDGRARLLDFGLARTEPLSSLTRQGALLGSLPYLAPEFLGGSKRSEETDALADVYALGATLYELLALQPAFRGSSVSDLVERIEAGRARPLRELNSRVTRDAATVVATAMKPEPSGRYASAVAFAEDLGNVLAGRPIVARPPGSLRLLWRWVVRHPGGAAALALVGVTLVGVPLSWSLQERSARARIEAEVERAEQNLAAASNAIDLLSSLGRDDLVDVPGAGQVRRRMLESALSFYEDLAARNADTDSMRLAVARAHRNAGIVNGALGDLRRALTELVQASEAYERELEIADDPEVRVELAGTLVRASVALWGAHRAGESLTAAERSVAVFENVDVAGSASRLRELSLAEQGLGMRRLALGNAEGARADLARAAEHARRAFELDPGESRAQWVSALRDEGTCLGLLGDLDAARVVQEQALELAHEVPRGGKALDRALPGLCLALSATHLRRQDFGSARDVLEEGREAALELCRAYPDGAQHRDELARIHLNLAAAAAGLDDRDALARNCARAEELIDELRERFPETRTNDELTQILAGLKAHAAQSTTELEEAIETYLDLARANEDRARAGDPRAVHSLLVARIQAAHSAVLAGRAEQVWTLLEPGVEFFDADARLAAAAVLSAAVDALEEGATREELAAHGCGLLLEVIEAGHVDAALIAESDELAGLRSQGAFAPVAELLGRAQR